MSGPYLLRAAVDLVPAAVRLHPVALAALVGYGVGTSTGAGHIHLAVASRNPRRRAGRVFASFDLT